MVPRTLQVVSNANLKKFKEVIISQFITNDQLLHLNRRGNTNKKKTADGHTLKLLKSTNIYYDLQGKMKFFIFFFFFFKKKDKKRTDK